MTWAVPTITGIQRMTAMITLATSLMVAILISLRAAIGCLTGGLFMIGNLFVLVMVGKAIIGLAQGGATASIGAVIAPFKMLIMAAVVYWLIAVIHVEAVGFCIGLSTQLVAVLIETARVSLSTTTRSCGGT
jgi:hypothetical protein